MAFRASRTVRTGTSSKHNRRVRLATPDLIVFVAGRVQFFESRAFTSMKLSLKSIVIAGALFKAIGFLFVSLLNVILRPYGRAYLVLLASL